MFANDRRIAYLPVAERQFVVGKADRPGIVGPFGEAEGFGQKRDAARRLSTGSGNPAVHPPEVRQPGRIGTLTDIGWSPERLRRLPKVILKQPGLCEGGADPNLVLPSQPRLAKRTDEQRRRLGAVSMFEGFDSTVV